MTKLRIICSIFDPNVGGPVIRARAVYEKMNSRGYEASVIIPDLDGSAAEYVAQAGISIDKLAMKKPVLPRKFIGFLSYLIFFPQSVLCIFKYLRRKKPDVVHVNGAFDFVPAIAAKLAGIPIVWHLNDTLFSPSVSRALGRFVRLMANQVVVAAEQVGRHYGIPIHEAAVLYAPVDIYRFKPRDLNHVPQTPIKLIMVGNWNWIKGQDQFIDVVRILLGGGTVVAGKIIGRFLDSQKGFWLPIVNQINDLGLDQYIEARGFSPDIPEELARADILLLTSRSEACPICVLEAMAIGVPVVSFDVGGVREILGEGPDSAGIIVPLGDVNSMADAVTRLTNDTELYHRCAAHGQLRAAERFSLDACVKKHEEIYQNVVRISA